MGRVTQPYGSMEYYINHVIVGSMKGIVQDNLWLNINEEI